jgi:hypothetical protein
MQKTCRNLTTAVVYFNIMNNHERKRIGKRKAAKLAPKLGWGRTPFDELPVETQLALQSDKSTQIKKIDDRKRFGKRYGKRGYGHFCAYCINTHLGKKAWGYRQHERDNKEDIDDSP